MALSRATAALCILALSSTAWARQLASPQGPQLACFTLAPTRDGPRPGAVVAAANRAGSAVCARWQSKCTKADVGYCSPAEIKAGTFKWLYAAIQGGPSGSSLVSCGQVKAALAAVPFAKDVTCCTTNKCNAPDPRLDKVTKVVSGK